MIIDGLVPSSLPVGAGCHNKVCALLAAMECLPRQYEKASNVLRF